MNLIAHLEPKVEQNRSQSGGGGMYTVHTVHSTQHGNRALCIISLLNTGYTTLSTVLLHCCDN